MCLLFLFFIDEDGVWLLGNGDTIPRNNPNRHRKCNAVAVHWVLMLYVPLLHIVGAPIAQLGERRTLYRNVAGFTHLGRDVSLSKTLHPSFLLLVKPRKPSKINKKLLTWT